MKMLSVEQLSVITEQDLYLFFGVAPSSPKDDYLSSQPPELVRPEKTVVLHLKKAA